MKRELFVFAGQSNMMGASVYPPQNELCVENSFEYKHRDRRLGKDFGQFVKAGYPVGEFSYIDIDKAYSPEMINEKGESTLNNFRANTYFCPSISNLKSDDEKSVCDFLDYSEATVTKGATLAPLLAEKWEQLGRACAYAHISKGGVPIEHYFTEEMAKEYNAKITAYNEKNGTEYAPVSTDPSIRAAGGYFVEKCLDFFTDADKHFAGDDMSDKCLIWLQGESDAKRSTVEYEMKSDILWEGLKRIGFTHFFCVRVDYFGSRDIHKVMRAQENFVSRHKDAYMLTRAASYITFPRQSEDDWFVSPPDEEYRNCRDSYFGFKNHHINEKGFSVIAEHGVKNLYRVLVQKEEPILEEENIKELLSE